MIKVLIAIGVIAYILINVITSNMMSAKEMRRNFVCGQCMVGMICANIFYAPAWALKGIRAFVLATIK